MQESGLLLNEVSQSKHSHWFKHFPEFIPEIGFEFRTLLEKVDDSALKVKRFQPNFAIFFACFFANSENATKSKETSKFRQERLNILSTLKFVGSHLAFYE